MLEDSLIKVATALGGFAGLVAIVLMIWFLRAQQAGAQLTNTLVGEIVKSRQESAEIIANNTRAMLEQVQVVKQVCESLTAHDRQAKQIHRDVRYIADTLRIRLQSDEDNHAE